MSAASIAPDASAGYSMDDRPATCEPETRPVYSVVAPVYNERETIAAFYARVVAVMEELGEAFELVLVDDGSQDGSAEALRALAARPARARHPPLA